MKNGALIFNVVLLVLVGVLFYLHFSSKQSTTPKVQSVQNKQQATTNTDFRIGYFEWDSISNRFEMFKAFQNEINQREENNERKKLGLKQQYENKVNSYSSRTDMSQTESMNAAQQIKNLEQSITNEMRKMDQELNDYTVRKQKELKTNIEDFLREYTKQNHFSYIFAFEPGFMFYRDTAYNITSDLVKGLNQKYPRKK
ncbi:MAG: OmpH family outer membrane protein [Flavisolibacter sp.]